MGLQKEPKQHINIIEKITISFAFACVDMTNPQQHITHVRGIALLSLFRMLTITVYLSIKVSSLWNYQLWRIIAIIIPKRRKKSLLFSLQLNKLLLHYIISLEQNTPNKLTSQKFTFTIWRNVIDWCSRPFKKQKKIDEAEIHYHNLQKRLLCCCIGRKDLCI